MKKKISLLLAMIMQILPLAVFANEKAKVEALAPILEEMVKFKVTYKNKKAQYSYCSTTFGRG